MTKLSNSTRSLPHAVYTPLHVKGEAVVTARKPWIARALSASLRPSKAEIAALRAHFEARGGDAAAKGALAALAVFEAHPATPGAPVVLDDVAPYAGLPPRAVSDVARELVALRRTDAESAVSAYRDLLKLHAPAPHRKTAGAPETKVVHEQQTSPLGGDHAASDRTVLIRAAAPETAAPARRFVADLLDAAPSSHAGAAAKVLHALSALGIDPSRVPAGGFEGVAGAALGQLGNLLSAYEQQVKVDPVGVLHLHRIDFSPAGIERGEMVHTVPLTPGEEVMIAHREWSNTSQEFEKIVTDYLEDFSESGVTEKGVDLLRRPKANRSRRVAGTNRRSSASLCR
jgi:hypothetical protein